MANACSASQPYAGTDSGFGSDAPTNTSNDASLDINTQPGATWPTLVFVDGLVNGFATASNGTSITLDNVRVCLFEHSSKKALTKYAMPDGPAMPLANYPGIRRGTGLDVGSFTVNGTVDIAIFPASELEADSTASTNRVAYACPTMTCDSTSPCQPHVSLSVELVEDVNVVGLVDTTAGGVALVQSKFEDNPFSGAPGSLSAGVVDFSGWHSGSTVAAFYGNYVDGSGTVNVALADPLTPNVATRPSTIDQSVTSTTYDALGIRFDEFSGKQVADRFGQSLDSIAYLSNPALDPPTFYGVRQNFVFALVGDPTDVTSVTSQGGRDWQFKGTGLHVTAVPYATPLPQ